MIFLKILFTSNFIQLTPTIRLPSYHATGFGGDYACYATLKVRPCKSFDSVHALLCTKRHDGYNPIYRHLSDRAQSGAGVLSIHPSQRQGRDRLSFSSNRCTENYRGDRLAMLLPAGRSRKRPDIFARAFYCQASLTSNGPASANIFIFKIVFNVLKVLGVFNPRVKLHFKSWSWFYPGPPCIL